MKPCIKNSFCSYKVEHATIKRIPGLENPCCWTQNTAKKLSKKIWFIKLVMSNFSY